MKKPKNKFSEVEVLFMELLVIVGIAALLFGVCLLFTGCSTIPNPDVASPPLPAGVVTGKAVFTGQGSAMPLFVAPPAVLQVGTPAYFEEIVGDVIEHTNVLYWMSHDMVSWKTIGLVAIDGNTNSLFVTNPPPMPWFFKEQFQ